MGHHKNGMKSTRLGAFPDARGDALFSTVETVLETLTQNKLFKYFSRETIKTEEIMIQEQISTLITDIGTLKTQYDFDFCID